jgi:hypothetical protein
VRKRTIEAPLQRLKDLQLHLNDFICTVHVPTDSIRHKVGPHIEPRVCLEDDHETCNKGQLRSANICPCQLDTPRIRAHEQTKVRDGSDGSCRANAIASCNSLVTPIA